MMHVQSANFKAQDQDLGRLHLKVRIYKRKAVCRERDIGRAELLGVNRSITRRRGVLEGRGNRNEKTRTVNPLWYISCKRECSQTRYRAPIIAAVRQLSARITQVCRDCSNPTSIRLLRQDGALRILNIITTISILATPSDALAIFPEQERDHTAEQTDTSKEGARPLVSKTIIQLVREQHDTRAPKGADECLRSKRRRRAVLVRVDEVVVGGVVDEDEAEADGEAGERGADPDEARERGPREDDQAERDEPACEHHGDQT